MATTDIRLELDRVPGFRTNDTEERFPRWDGSDRLFSPSPPPLPHLSAPLNANDNYFKEFLKKVCDPKLSEIKRSLWDRLLNPWGCHLG